jgi:phospholipid-binding lipoprotein MlaA
LLGASSLIEAAALDRYSFLRDSYLQRRNYLIHDGEVPDKDGGAPDEKQDDNSAPAQPSAPEPATPTTPASPKVG